MNPGQLECTLSQRFGDNATDLYASTFLDGHPGDDESCGYGSDIDSYVEGDVPYLYTPDKPADDGYTSIFIICKTPLEYFEFSYGHVSQINVKIGDHITKGQLVGKEGNKGAVYHNGVRITLEQQRDGSTEGSHRHVQKRVLYRVQSTTPHDKPMKDAHGIFHDPNGYRYIQALPNNGYNSCVDFLKPIFNTTLLPGSSGYYVSLWQKALVLQGFADFVPTGFYGALTFAATRAFQKAAGLDQVGVAGPKTRGIMNAIYHQV